MRYDKIPPLAKWISDSQPVTIGVSRGPTLRAPMFKATDALIELYHKAFQPMSKRNVLFDLETELEKGFLKLSPGQSDAVKALKDVVKIEVGKLPARRRYEKVVCIGWNVGCNYETRQRSGAATNTTQYFRHSNTDQLDMKAKCKEMFSAISEARKIIDGHALVEDWPEETLKVFMAPEFYFRGMNGAYAPEIVSEIIPELQKLGTDSNTYQDWLFIFGTAVAAIEIERTVCTTCPAPSSVKFVPDSKDKTKTIALCTKNAFHKTEPRTLAAEIQNVALVQKGKETALVAKEYISNIDYKNMQVNIHPGTSSAKTVNVVPARGSMQRDGLITDNDERLGGCRLTIDGVRIALEICLDHSQGGGRASALQGSTQILLIPSYGMEIGTGLYCVAGGVAFNVDGRGTGSTEVVVKGDGASKTLTKRTLSSEARGTTIEFSDPLAIPYT